MWAIARWHPVKISGRCLPSLEVTRCPNKNIEFPVVTRVQVALGGVQVRLTNPETVNPVPLRLRGHLSDVTVACFW